MISMKAAKLYVNNIPQQAMPKAAKEKPLRTIVAPYSGATICS